MIADPEYVAFRRAWAIVGDNELMIRAVRLWNAASDFALIVPNTPPK
jgi:hypothetical protein